MLTAPGAGPAEIGAALHGWPRTLVVAEDLGGPEERLTTLPAAEAAGRAWHPLNVVLCLRDPDAVPARGWYAGGEPAPPPGGWALPEDAFEHRAGMVTKAEVRALALARLAPAARDAGLGRRRRVRARSPSSAPGSARPCSPSSAGPTTPRGSRPTPRAHGVDVRVVAGRGARPRWPACPRRTRCSSAAAARRWWPRRPRPGRTGSSSRSPRWTGSRPPGRRCAPPATPSTACSWRRPGWPRCPTARVRLAATNPVFAGLGATSPMIALVAVTAAGRRAAAEVAGRARRRRPPSWPSCPRCGRELDGAVFFLATGATVRLIAPLLADKHTDPGVVCVDEAGRFAVALAGGHGGGANALAARVGRACSAPSR